MNSGPSERIDNETRIVENSDFPGFDNFRLLGEGATGIVYCAFDAHLDRTIAIKVTKAELINEDVLRRFKLEAKSLATLHDENIVEIYKTGLSKRGQPYFVMEYLEGLTLRQFNASKKLTPAEFVFVFRRVLEGLAYLHEHGVIHRDIKPDNIMLIPTGSATSEQNDTSAKSFSSVKILDFGIAKILDADPSAEVLAQTQVPDQLHSAVKAKEVEAKEVEAKEAETKSKQQNALTGTLCLLGTPTYMSPEQCKQSSIDQRSDLYSTACVMYECLTGTQLFSGNTAAETMYKHLQEDTTSLVKAHSWSKNLDEFFCKALAREREKRFQSASEMLRGLHKLADSDLCDLRINDKSAKKSSKWLIACGIFFTLIGLAGLYNVASRRIVSARPPGKLHSREENVSAASLLNDAKSLYDKKKYAEAFEKYYESADLAGSKKDRKIEINALVALGEKKLLQKEYMESETIHRKILALPFLNRFSSNDRALAEIRLAKALFFQNKFSEAQQRLRKMLKDKEERKIGAGMDMVLEARLTLMKVDAATRNYKEAKQLADISDFYFKESQYIHFNEAAIMLQMIEQLQKLGENIEAKKKLNTMLVKAPKILGDEEPWRKDFFTLASNTAVATNSPLAAKEFQEYARKSATGPSWSAVRKELFAGDDAIARGINSVKAMRKRIVK